MPCQDYGRSDGSYERRQNVTRLLCEVMTHMESVLPATHLVVLGKVEGLERWWTEHKRLDAERLEREQQQAEEKRLRQQALGKLTRA